MTIKPKASWAEVATELIELNPDHHRYLSLDGLLENVEVDPQDPSHVLKDKRYVENAIDLRQYDISRLPESFGDLSFDGNLLLGNNCITTLPESFGRLVVGGGLELCNNHLESLPASFGNLTIGSDLNLHGNRLCSLPHSFGSLSIGGRLDLDRNRLVSLPDTFGNLILKGPLFLGNNQLASLPDSFGNLVLGDIDNRVVLALHDNCLKTLPDSIGNLTLSGDLQLKNNDLVSLPETFHNIAGAIGQIDLDPHLLEESSCRRHQGSLK